MMQDLTRSHMRQRAKEEIFKTLQKLNESKLEANDVSFQQQDEFRDALEFQIERVLNFLGY